MFGIKHGIICATKPQILTTNASLV